MLTSVFRGPCSFDALQRFFEKDFRGAEHRMVRRGLARPRRGQHQQSRELGGHLTQVFEQRLAFDDVRNGEIVRGGGHGPGLYKQKGGRP